MDDNVVHGMFGKDEIWECICGETLFLIKETGAVCSNCGVMTPFEIEVEHE